MDISGFQSHSCFESYEPCSSSRDGTLGKLCSKWRYLREIVWNFQFHGLETRERDFRELDFRLREVCLCSMFWTLLCTYCPSRCYSSPVPFLLAPGTVHLSAELIGTVNCVTVDKDHTSILAKTLALKQVLSFWLKCHSLRPFLRGMVSVNWFTCLCDHMTLDLSWLFSLIGTVFWDSGIQLCCQSQQYCESNCQSSSKIPFEFQSLFLNAFF